MQPKQNRKLQSHDFVAKYLKKLHNKMKKIAALSTLFAFLFIVPLFSQSKKDKIEKLITIQSKYYTLEQSIKNFDKMVDEEKSFKRKSKYESNSGITDLSTTIINLMEPEILKDTALYYHKERVKRLGEEYVRTNYKKDMEESLQLYDSAYSEQQIDKMLVAFTSPVGKKYLLVEDSLNPSHSAPPIDDNHMFAPGRKEKIDSLFDCIVPLSTKSALSKMMDSALYANLKKMNMENMYTQMKAQVAEQTEVAEAKRRVNKEILFDRNFSNRELDSLIEYYGDPDVIKAKEIAIQLGMVLSKRRKAEFDEYTAKMKKLK